MKKHLYVMLILMSSAFESVAQQFVPINNSFPGQNSWLPASYAGNPTSGGNLETHWGDVKKSSCQFVRVGGIDFDKWLKAPADFNKFVDTILARNMTPIVQLSLFKSDHATVYDDTVTAINDNLPIVNAMYAKGVRYFSIGNEPNDPDLNHSTSYPYSVQNSYGQWMDDETGISTFFKAISRAAKNAHPDIFMMGPDLSWFNTSILSALISIPNASHPYSICGTIGGGAANGKYFLDYLDMHIYPFPYDQTVTFDAQGVKDYIETPGKFRDYLSSSSATGLKHYITLAGRTPQNLKIALTEANVTTANPSTDGPSSYGAMSFLGGQFWAEMMAVAMEEEVQIMNFWSVREGQNIIENRGYLDRSTGNKQASYWHYQMVAKYMKGMAVRGNTTSTTYLKPFASKLGNSFVIMILNQTGASKTYSVHLNSSSFTASPGDEKININGGINTTLGMSFTVPADASQWIMVDDCGQVTSYWTYTETDYAANPTTHKPVQTIVTTTPCCVAANSDLYMRDFPSDIDGSVDTGVEPDPIGGYMYLSNDIWVRNTNDGFINQSNSTNIIATSSSSPLYVYVKVRNRGCQPSLGTEQLYLHWAKAATSLSWPGNWNGTVDLDPPNNLTAGNVIGNQTISTIAAGGETILEFAWFPPNPSDYSSVNTEPMHFCLLARVVASNDPMYATEGPALWSNVIQNNNIVWKNITMIDNIPGIIAGGGCPDDIMQGIGRGVIVGNYDSKPATYDIKFSVPKQELLNPITSEGTVVVALNNDLYKKWVQGGKKGTGVKELLSPPMSDAGGMNNNGNHNSPVVVSKRHAFEISGTSSTFENITFAANEYKSISLMVLYPSDPVSKKQTFYYDITQSRTNNGEIIGGVRYTIEKPDPRTLKPTTAGDDKTIKRGCSTTLTASPIVDCGIYYWLDENAKIVGNGPSLNVSPVKTTTYTLKAFTPQGFVSEDKVTVYVTNQLCERKREIVGVSPNPAHERITVKYNVEETTRAQIKLLKADNTVDRTYTLDLQASEITLNISDCATGVYGIILICDGVRADSKNVVIH